MPVARTSSDGCPIEGLIKVIFFDAAGTLFDLKESAGTIYHNFASRYGFVPARIESIKVDLERSFAIEFRASPPLCFWGEPAARIPDLERQWWYRIVKRVFEDKGDFADFDNFFDDVYHLFGTSEPWSLEENCLETLRELRSRGFKMGVISNFDSRLFGLLEELGIANYFQYVTISSHAPAAKPDSRIFRTALQKAGVGERHCLHAGDRLEDDVKGAKAAGLQAVLYDPDERFAADEAIFRISRLTELCRLLV